MGDLVHLDEIRAKRALPEPMLPLTKIMELYGFSRRWWEYRATEGLPRHRWGGRWRYRASEVENWMRERGHAREAG